jgi:hypothetical protein
MPILTRIFMRDRMEYIRWLLLVAGLAIIVYEPSSYLNVFPGALLCAIAFRRPILISGFAGTMAFAAFLRSSVLVNDPVHHPWSLPPCYFHVCLLVFGLHFFLAAMAGGLVIVAPRAFWGCLRLVRAMATGAMKAFFAGARALRSVDALLVAVCAVVVFCVSIAFTHMPVSNDYAAASKQFHKLAALSDTQMMRLIKNDATSHEERCQAIVMLGVSKRHKTSSFLKNIVTTYAPSSPEAKASRIALHQMQSFENPVFFRIVDMLVYYWHGRNLDEVTYLALSQAPFAQTADSEAVLVPFWTSNNITGPTPYKLQDVDFTLDLKDEEIT